MATGPDGGSSVVVRLLTLFQQQPYDHAVPGSAPAKLPGLPRGLPSPCLTVIFTLHERLVVAGHPDPGQAPGRYNTLAGGLHTAPAMITHEGAQSGVQLAVSPLGARALLGVPAGELASIDVDGTDVLGSLASEIQDRLLAAATWPERFAVLDELLLARMDAGAEAAGHRAGALAGPPGRT